MTRAARSRRPPAEACPSRRAAQAPAAPEAPKQAEQAGRVRLSELSSSVPAALSALSARVTSCRACPRLVAWREAVAKAPPAAHRGETYWARPLPGFGDPRARLVVVGLAPAANGGNRTGRMFTGDRSGDFLVAALHRYGFASQPTSRSMDDGLRLIDCYLTAPVRCAPPDNRPTPTERDACAPFLHEELGILGAARVYLALGTYAYASLLHSAAVIGRPPRPYPPFGHGLEVRLSADSPGEAGTPPLRAERSIICSYHPSQRNVFTGLLTSAMFDEVLESARTRVRG
ncbi:MAG: uracil-DNA glycosylase [Acidimicrobiales bacterium]